MQIFSADWNLKAVKLHQRQIKENLQEQAIKITKDMNCGSVLHRPLGKRKIKGIFEGFSAAGQSYLTEGHAEEKGS